MNTGPNKELRRRKKEDTGLKLQYDILRILIKTCANTLYKSNKLIQCVLLNFLRT